MCNGVSFIKGKARTLPRHRPSWRRRRRRRQRSSDIVPQAFAIQKHHSLPTDLLNKCCYNIRHTYKIYLNVSEKHFMTLLLCGICVNVISYN